MLGVSFLGGLFYHRVHGDHGEDTEGFWNSSWYYLGNVWLFEGNIQYLLHH